MKKFLLIIALALACAGGLSAQLTLGPPAPSTKMTIDSDVLRAIIDDEVKKGIAEAVRLAVIDYEKKLAEKDQTILDKDIEITNLKADRDAAVAKAIKFEKLYNIEKANSNKTGLIIGIGVGAFLLGYGINALIP